MTTSMSQWDFEEARRLGYEFDFRGGSWEESEEDSVFSESDTTILYRGIEYVRDACGEYHYEEWIKPGIRTSYNEMDAKVAIDKAWEAYQRLDRVIND